MRNEPLLVLCRFLSILFIVISFGAIAVLASTPMLVQEEKLLASDRSPEDGFGISTALYGDTAVIAAHLEDSADVDAGCAYIFNRSGSIWTEQAQLFAPDPYPGARFGKPVILFEDTMFLGAHRDENGRGAVYVFSRDGTGAWIFSQKLIGSFNPAGAWDFFGYSLALSGDTLVVGSPDANSAGYSTGTVYVFVREGTHWVEQQRIIHPMPVYNSYFGHAVAVSGDTLAGSAVRDDGNAPGSGSVYIYRRTDAVWVLDEKVVPTDGATSDGFGVAVELRENMLLVGADGDDDQGEATGSVYMFVHDGTSWMPEAQKLLPTTPVYNQWFGTSMELSEATLLVGAPRAAEPHYGAGAVDLFIWDGSGWAPHQRVLPEVTTGGSLFGNKFGVSMFGSTALIGAYRTDDPDGGDDCGAAYVFGPDILLIEIDIKPGSFPNCFNINGHGVIPVALFGSDVFDVATVDVNTLSFAGLAVRVRGKRGPMCAFEELNGDSYTDMVCHFEDDVDNWVGGGDTAEVTGQLFDGTNIKGSDSICVVP